MPFDLIEQVFLVDHRRFGQGCHSFWEFLTNGDEFLIGGIPICPGVFWNFDLRFKLQVNPIQGFANRQAFLSD